ncbi:hypothetical protein HS088_TW09G00519 [Tripterygium wilfordii]|uniref:Alpha/beta hydrolase fold-3 domain-containing protein n=1 Tax=Tripterygium wilfordii TaxID=458696 RepID=A0A7J7D7X8_TRIWF|nr:probable carboxylesterase 15 [Tripterygium wilfordii]KAF5742470.1 hypothetical protein HS088_TW09G00519 [Tripterygium wilfordii]
MQNQKRIIHDVSGWLRVYDDGSVDRTWTGPPEVKFMAEPVPPHNDFVNGVATRDVTVHDSLRVRVYLPEHEPIDGSKLPIILHFHGGGFCISQADWYMYYNTYTRLAKLSQAIIVSVFLRLAPEDRLPASINDGYSALLWLKSLSQGESHEQWLNSYGDFNRVFLIGDSSGGNIVHEVAARAGHVNLNPLRLAGAIPIHPGFVRAERSRSELERPQSPFLTLDMLDKFLSLALPVGSTKDHHITCPMGPTGAVAGFESLRMPAVLLCVAENDLIWDTEMEYYEAMKKANKDVELLINPGMTHSFYLNKIAIDTDPNTAAQTEGLLQGITEFVKKH